MKIEVPTLAELKEKNKKAEIVFWVGCAGSFDERAKKSSHIMGLTASPERRTGNQNDQLGLVFDAIIDCADIKTLIEDKVLVQPIYRPHFIHDLNLNNAVRFLNF